MFQWAVSLTILFSTHALAQTPVSRVLENVDAVEHATLSAVDPLRVLLVAAPYLATEEFHNHRATVISAVQRRLPTSRKSPLEYQIALRTLLAWKDSSAFLQNELIENLRQLERRKGELSRFQIRSHLTPGLKLLKKVQFPQPETITALVDFAKGLDPSDQLVTLNLAVAWFGKVDVRASGFLDSRRGQTLQACLTLLNDLHETFRIWPVSRRLWKAAHVRRLLTRLVGLSVGRPARVAVASAPLSTQTVYGLLQLLDDEDFQQAAIAEIQRRNWSALEMYALNEYRLHPQRDPELREAVGEAIAWRAYQRLLENARQQGTRSDLLSSCLAQIIRGEE
ncbi:hypothetical protein K2X33_07845 [bacterium]|nr:hypothetical protein [bacterium]